MARASNVTITILNVIFLVVSLVTICFSIWLHIGANDHNLCNKSLQKPLLYVGLGLFVLSFLGFIGSCCRFSFFMWIYLALVFLLVLAMICFTVFTIMVTNQGAGRALSKKGLQSAKLGDYSNWLQNHVFSGEKWAEVKSCLVKMNFCHKVANGKDADFYKKNLTPIQSGCCKPPVYCGFEFQNATVWEMPKTGPAVPDSDCKTWSNVQTELCFECKSCKASILYSIKNEWRILAIANVIIIVIIIIVYAIGNCALKGNRAGSYKHKKLNA